MPAVPVTPAVRCRLSCQPARAFRTASSRTTPLLVGHPRSIVSRSHLMIMYVCHHVMYVSCHVMYVYHHPSYPRSIVSHSYLYPPAYLAYVTAEPEEAARMEAAGCSSEESEELDGKERVRPGGEEIGALLCHTSRLAQMCVVWWLRLCLWWPLGMPAASLLLPGPPAHTDPCPFQVGPNDDIFSDPPQHNHNTRHATRSTRRALSATKRAAESAAARAAATDLTAEGGSGEAAGGAAAEEGGEAAAGTAEKKFKRRKVREGAAGEGCRA